MFTCSAVLIRSNIFSRVVFLKLKIIKKHYFPKDMKENLTEITPTKTNRASMEHKVVLILSNELIRNIFFTFCCVYFDARGYE